LPPHAPTACRDLRRDKNYYGSYPAQMKEKNMQHCVQEWWGCGAAVGPLVVVFNDGLCHQSIPHSHANLAKQYPVMDLPCV